jgi:hypothetical protein
LGYCLYILNETPAEMVNFLNYQENHWVEV